MDFTGPKCIHFQTLKIFQCRGFICCMFWQRAQGNLQLPATLDVQFRKLCRSIVGPPPEVDWNAAWNKVPSANANVNTWSYIICKNYWNLARHVAALPAHWWVRRLLSWHFFGTRRIGRPRLTWESKPHAYCRYANLRSWREVDDAVSSRVESNLPARRQPL